MAAENNLGLTGGEFSMDFFFQKVRCNYWKDVKAWLQQSPIGQTDLSSIPHLEESCESRGSSGLASVPCSSSSSGSSPLIVPSPDCEPEGPGRDPDESGVPRPGPSEGAAVCMIFCRTSLIFSCRHNLVGNISEYLVWKAAVAWAVKEDDLKKVSESEKCLWKGLFPALTSYLMERSPAPGTAAWPGRASGPVCVAGRSMAPCQTPALSECPHRLWLKDEEKSRCWHEATTRSASLHFVLARQLVIKSLRCSNFNAIKEVMPQYH